MEELIATKYYTPKKLVKMNVLPWASAMTFKSRLMEPQWKEIFKPIIETKNGRDMIYIKGEYIINFVKLAANGELNITNEISK